MTTSTINLQQIVNEIDNYIRSGGGGYAAWYCGIASDPRQRLFNDHNVQEQGGFWIFRPCGTDTNARAVENAFLDAGCKGGPCGGDHTTTFVYAYKITSTTRE